MGVVRNEIAIRVVFTILLCGLGVWFASSGRAKFQFGGSDSPSGSRPIHVDARGLDAVAIGSLFFGLGIVNLALGIRDDRRIAVFWTGAAFFGAAVVYGIVQALTAVVELFVQR